MSYTESFQIWAEDNLIQYEWIVEGVLLEINGVGLCLIKKPDESKRLFDKEMFPLITQEEEINIRQAKVDYFIFEFGDSWFYSDVEKKIEFIPLEMVGCAYQQIHKKDYAFLGIHGKYEVMSGTREYADWCKKAQFLGIETLGICEKSTLAGTLSFQVECLKRKIRPIIGYTARIENENGDVYEIKIYVKSENGWRTLLQLHNRANVETAGIIDELQLFEAKLEGLAIILSPTERSYDKRQRFLSTDADIYWQFTSNEYKSDQRDLTTLEISKLFMNTQIQPVLLSDAFTLNVRDNDIRRKLLTLSKKKGDDIMESRHGHFKSIDEQFMDIDPLFKEDSFEELKVFFNKAVDGTKRLSQSCFFEIDTKTLHLPNYEQNRTERRQFNGDNEKMFFTLIELACQEYLLNQESKYLDFGNTPGTDEIRERVEKEIDVIRRGGFIDYFLILWDIVRWCERKKIQVGPGRGSAAGSLVSYLLGIVKIDPLDYGLLFERFLNESRIKSSMPDIDLDFASDRRDEVIEYMKMRYGNNYVCRVGTYGTLQMRGLFQDLNRYYGALPTKELHYLSKMIDEDNERWEAVFVDAASKSKLKSFVKGNVDLINDCRKALGSIKSSSMHACATIVFPKKKDVDGNVLDIFSQIPIRMEEGTLVSEWEGGVLEKAGFLKEDILSTRQMAKFGHIFELIEERYGKIIKTENIPFDDEDVLKLFCDGLNQDVFHFGSEGLTNYLKQLKPQRFEDLIAAIALYRPGAIQSKSHDKYIQLKEGKESPQYDYMLESVTKETYGLYIYQEQIMKAAQVLGNFSLADADGIRKAMGKKIKDLMDGYKVQFVENSIQNGCLEKEANEIWDKMEVFSGYGFNKSHAAAYAAIGYYCNWLKYYYPLEFWTVAFDLSKEDHIPAFLSEIRRMNQVKISPPDINESKIRFYSDPEKNTIYWSIEKISYVGEVATQHILEERHRGGKFFSMEEFLNRVEKRKVNKRTVTHLILAGAFDEMYNIQKPTERAVVLREACIIRKEDVPEEFLSETAQYDYFWSMKQMDVAKLGDMNYSKLINTLSTFKNEGSSLYKDSDQFHSSDFIEDDVLIAGVITEVEERNAANGKFCTITLSNGDHMIKVRIWGQVWENQRDDDRFKDLRVDILAATNRILLIKGRVQGPCKYHAHNMLYVQNYRQGSVYEIF